MLEGSSSSLTGEDLKPGAKKTAKFKIQSDSNEELQNRVAHSQYGGTPLFASETAGVCAACKGTFKHSHIKAIGRLWHDRCFICHSCKEELSETWHEHSEKPYCEACHGKLYCPRCAKCGKAITGYVANAMMRKWHLECFRCVKCNIQIDHSGKSFYVHQNQPFCMKCWSAKQ